MTTLARPIVDGEPTTRSLEALLPPGAVESLTRPPPEPVTGVCIYGEGDTTTLAGQVVVVPQAAGHGMAATLSELAVRGAVGAMVGGVCPVRDIPAELKVWRRGPNYAWLEIVDAVRALLRPRTAPELVDTAPGALDSLADALAGMLGGPVIIEDAWFRVLSYSAFTGAVDRGRDAAILGRRMPPEWCHHLERVGALEALMTSEAIVDLPDGPQRARRRLMASVVADGQLVGILSVAEAGRPLPADVADRMLKAQRIAAPHLLRHRETQVAEGWERANSLRQLLHGRPPSRALLEELGLAPAVGYVVLGLRHADGDISDMRRRARLVETVTLYCQAYRWRSAVTAVGGTVYCLLALSAHQSVDRIRTLANGLARSAATGTCPGLHVAMSEPAEQLSALAASRAQVDEIGEYLLRTALGGPRVAGGRDVGAALVLNRAADTLRADSTRLYDRLMALDAFDAEHGTDDAATLAAYLATFGNANLAAGRLGVHRTTVLYRLRRITEQIGIKLDDPDERLLCALLLRDRDATLPSESRPQ